MAAEPSKICPTVDELPDGWRVKRLGSFCVKIGTGATPRGGSEVYLDSRVSHALIRSQHVFDRHFDSSGLAFISEAHAEELRNAEVQSGDVLLNITGDGVTFGRSCIVPERILPACVNQHVSIIRPDRNVCDPGYLLAVLTHPATKGYIESFNSGGSRRAITKGHIESFEIPLPPLVEQQAIAAVLGSLDDKIELNRRMNATLEAMACALFQSWFVDFEPVRAKIDGRQIVGLDSAGAALFPASFQDSALGPIPKGWRIDSIYEIANVIYGAPFASALFNTERLGKPLVRIRDLAKEDPAVYTTELHPKGYSLKPGDIAVGMDGEFRAYLWAGVDSWLNQRVCVFAPKAGYSPSFVRNSIVAPLAQVEATETATTVIHIGKNDIDRFLVVIPDASVVEAFTRHCQPWYDQIVANKQQSRTLAKLRDALLPRLLSGDISLNQ